MTRYFMTKSVSVVAHMSGPESFELRFYLPVWLSATHTPVEASLCRLNFFFARNIEILKSTNQGTWTLLPTGSTMLATMSNFIKDLWKMFFILFWFSSPWSWISDDLRVKSNVTKELLCTRYNANVERGGWWWWWGASTRRAKTQFWKGEFSHIACCLLT